MTETNIRKMSETRADSDTLQFPNVTRPLYWGFILTILISIFLRIDSILHMGDLLYDANVNSILLYFILFGVQFFMGFALVVLILPTILPEFDLLQSTQSRLRPSFTLIISGIVSGGIFLIVAALISYVLGISNLDWSLLLATPDVYVDPDVVGWFYFVIALVPAIWEEIVFRGIILFHLRTKYSDRMAIFLSSLLFSLYHFSVIMIRPIETVVGGVIMSFFFGLAWGTLVLKSNSILPVVMAHYIIDSLGIVFLNVETSDPVVLTQFMILITIIYPVLHWIIFRFVNTKVLIPEN